MSTVRIDDKIKEEVNPILSELGLSLSEAINIFLHQIKIHKGIPFEIKTRENIELNAGKGSYICKFGHLHDYSELDIEELEKEAKNNKEYIDVNEMFKDILEE